MRHKTPPDPEGRQKEKAGPMPRLDGSSQAVRSGALLNLDALVGEELLQLAGLEHLAGDVAAADELALHVELGNGRPVGVVLDALAHSLVLKHVDALVGHAEVVEDLDHLP